MRKFTLISLFAIPSSMNIFARKVSQIVRECALSPLMATSSQEEFAKLFWSKRLLSSITTLSSHSTSHRSLIFEHSFVSWASLLDCVEFVLLGLAELISAHATALMLLLPKRLFLESMSATSMHWASATMHRLSTAASELTSSASILVTTAITELFPSSASESSTLIHTMRSSSVLIVPHLVVLVKADATAIIRSTLASVVIVVTTTSTHIRWCVSRSVRTSIIIITV